MKLSDIYHFEKINKKKIKAKFSVDGSHRYYLELPFFDKTTEKALCVIGQNPSKANKEKADKTIYFLERYVYEKLPNYSKIIMLNLYSRIDTNKRESIDLLTVEGDKIFRKIVSKNNDFLMIYGNLNGSKDSNGSGEYKFLERAKVIKELFKSKNVYKIDIGSVYPPHPGNPKLYYGNFCHGIAKYDFEDIN